MATETIRIMTGVIRMSSKKFKGKKKLSKWKQKKKAKNRLRTKKH